MKKALITGITGQDGSYLAELLLSKGYEVHGIIRRSSTFNAARIKHLESLHKYQHLGPSKLTLHYGDLTDSSNLNRILEKVRPDEIYNLAAQSHVRTSFDIPEYTGQVTGIGALRLLDAIRGVGINTKFYQASSSEMYGKAIELPLSERSPFYPRSPYGVAKVYAYWITKNYRESYGVFAVNGILFNHESPRRGENFVTRKITRGLSRINLGKDEKLFLGNLDAKRDWGHAEDYVEGMWRMLQHHTADDYVLATGETHTVREFVEKTAERLGMKLMWKGKGLKEVGIDTNTGKEIIAINPIHFRPAEVDILLGDYSKAKKILGWKPTTLFEDLVINMTEADFVAEGGDLSDIAHSKKTPKKTKKVLQKKTPAKKKSRRR